LFSLVATHGYVLLVYIKAGHAESLIIRKEKGNMTSDEADGDAEPSPAEYLHNKQLKK
jgi:hypothetical protein